MDDSCAFQVSRSALSAITLADAPCSSSSVRVADDIRSAARSVVSYLISNRGVGAAISRADGVTGCDATLRASLAASFRSAQLATTVREAAGRGASLKVALVMRSEEHTS